MIEGQGFVIVIRSFVSIKLDCLFESFQRIVVLLIFKVTESQIILGWSIIFYDFTGLGQVRNWFSIIFDLSIAVSSVKQGFEMSLSTFNVLDSLSEVDDGIVEIHQSGVDETSVKIIDSIVWFERYGLLKLSQRIIDLV